jgi:hypothetical protein
LSEHFEKTYISVNEFISSWEKEIYELNNLDYFTYLLINYIGYGIEHKFFTTQNHNAYLRIDPEEIATLSFNIGDSFESFLENNCFGDCSLSCPTKLNEMVNPDDSEIDATHLNIVQIMNGEDLSKKQFLLTDILNYVVVDTLFDFYNYEIGLDLDDADIGLMQFADFITVLLEKFIETQGQSFLKHPKEPAVDLFQKILMESEQDWDDSPTSTFEENEDKEEWKYGSYTITNLIQDYMDQNSKLLPNDRKLLEYFRNYCDSYAGILQFDDLSKEDLEEFFLFWLLREIALEKEISSDQIRTTFEKFFIWLEITHNTEIKRFFDSSFLKNRTPIENSLAAMRKYFEKNSLIGGILEANEADDQIVDGFFSVEKVSQNGLLRLKDIYFNQSYVNVKVNFEEIDMLRNTIFDASIKHTAYGWRIIHLEYIFPQKAKPYLH